MVDPTRVLLGLDDFTVLGASEDDDGELVVTVRLTRGEAPCPSCGVFSSRVKENRCQRGQSPVAWWGSRRSPRCAQSSSWG